MCNKKCLIKKSIRSAWTHTEYIGLRIGFCLAHLWSLGMGCSRRGDCVIVSGGETALLFICSYFVREYTSIVCSDWWFYVRASANVFFFFAIGISTSVIIFCGKDREMRVMHVLWNSWNWDLWMRIKSRSIWRRSFSNETEELSVYR